MASTEVTAGKSPPAPGIRRGDPISVRWRTIHSIASGNSWSRPIDARVLWFRRTPSFWMLGFVSPHTKDEQTVLAPRSYLQPTAFFTGYTASQQEQAVHRVRLGSSEDDTLRRSSMSLLQLLAHDMAIANSILTQTTEAWLTVGELMERLGDTRRDIERETDLLIQQGLLERRKRAISGRGRPSFEFGRIHKTSTITDD